jgi:hypothetical protein
MKRTDVAQYWEANAETWTGHARAGYDIYRDGLNTPAFLGMLPHAGRLRPERANVTLSRGAGRSCHPQASQRPRVLIYPPGITPAQIGRNSTMKTTRRRYWVFFLFFSL